MYRRETARLLYFQQTKVEEDDGAELPAGECDAEDPFIALGLLARNRRLERASLSNCRGAVSGSAHGFRVAGRHGESNTPCSGANRVLAQSGDMAAPKLTTENNTNAIATLGTTQGGIFPGSARHPRKFKKRHSSQVIHFNKNKTWLGPRTLIVIRLAKT